MDSYRSGPKGEHIEGGGQKTGRKGVDGKNRFVAALLIWGNHPIVISLWAVIGMICAMIAPTFLMKHEPVVDRVYMWTAFAGIFTCGLYIIGYLLRDTTVMRERRGWIQYAMGNYFASAIAIAVVVKYNNTPDTVIGFMLVAVAVFAFMEMAKPVYDFELLQFFLRLPLQMAIACYIHHSVGRHILAAALLLVFGTIWHDFFMQTFSSLPEETPVQTPPAVQKQSQPLKVPVQKPSKILR